MNKLVLFIMALTLSSCASLEKSLVLGAGIGAATGTATGFISDYNEKGVAFTAGMGLLLGVGTAYLIHSLSENETKLKLASERELSDTKDHKFPRLLNPEVRRICVDDKIEGNRFIESHCTYILERPSLWSR